jgi:hypothetical protein
MVDQERRAHARITLERPCKLYVPSVGRYVSGSTGNLSAAGVLIRLDLAAGVSAGDHVYVGIAFKRRQAVLNADEMLEAEVVRVDRTVDDHVTVAARFVDEAAEQVSPLPRAA